MLCETLFHYYKSYTLFKPNIMPTRKDNNVTIPLDLIESIKKGECVLFVASGLSSNVKRKNGKNLPGWKDFLLELLTWCQHNRVSFNSEPTEIEEMINKGNYLLAAQELQELISNNEFSEFLNSIFRDKNVKPTSNHIELTKIPFRAILTTNYDTLLEGAYALSNEGRLPNKYTQSDLSAALSPLRKKEFFIFKMHGDIDRSETIILGTRGYNNLLYKSPEYLSFLEILFTTQTVLFVGFGGSDPDLDYVIDRLSTVFSRTLNKHFLLAPSKKFNFTEKRRLLIDKRLEVIEYDPNNNHKGVDLFIQNLSSIFNDLHIKEVAESKDIKKNVIIISPHPDLKTYVNKIESYLQKIDTIDLSGWANFSHYFNVENEPSLESLLTTHEQGKKIDIFIILITKESVKSKNFEKEIELVLLRELENKITVIPVVIGDINVPYKIKSKLYLQFKEDFDETDLSTLVNSIINIV